MASGGKLPRRRFLKLRGNKVEVGFGLLLASLLEARAAHAAEADLPLVGASDADLTADELALLKPKLDKVELLSPEELKALLNAETLAALGLNAKQFHKLVDSDLKEAIRQLEAAFRKKLAAVSAQKETKVAANGDEAVAAASKATADDGDASEDASAMGGEMSLLWIIGGIAALGGALLAFSGGDDDNDGDDDDGGVAVNKAPVAANDAVTTAEDTPVTFDVRANDTDANNDALSVTHINGTAITTSAPVAVTGGSISLGADGKLTFTPTANSNTAASFTYTVSDGKGGTSTATTNINVTSVNDAPVNTVPGAIAVSQGAAVAVAGLSVADVDAGTATFTTTLTVQNGSLIAAAVNGGATISGSGSGAVILTGTLAQINASLGNISFNGGANFFGTTNLTVQTSDGQTTDTDVVAIAVAQVTNGLVQDGYVAFADVFIDSNGNGKHDAGEPLAKTDAAGRFSIASNLPGNIVAIGGTNTDTGLPNHVSLIAPQGSGIVNPLTTLVSAAMDQGQTATEANASVAAALGLPAGTTFTNVDILSSTTDPVLALAMQKAAVQIVTILAAASEAAAAGGEAAAQALVMTQLGQLLEAGGSIDLTSTATITSLLTVVPGITAAELAQASEETASTNQVVEEATSLKEIADTQVEVSNPNYNYPAATTDDVVGTNVGKSVILNVTANDIDPENSALTIVRVNGKLVSAGPVHLAGGVVSLNAEGKIVFTPDAAFVGQQTFNYTVSDGSNESTADVTVNVTPAGPVLVVAGDNLAPVIANAPALAAAGVTAIDVVDNAAAIADVEAVQLVNAGIEFVASDEVTVEAAGTQMSTSLKGLQDLNVDTVAISGAAGRFSVDAGEGGLGALSASDLPQFDVAQSDASLDVTLNVDGGMLDPTLDLPGLAAGLAAAGIDNINVNGSLSLNNVQAAGLAGAGLNFTGGSDITITTADIQSIDVAVAAAIGAGHLDVASNEANISDAEASLLIAAGIDFASSDLVTVEAAGTHLSTSLNDLKTLGVDVVDASGLANLTLDAGDLSALTSSGLPQFDTAQTDANLEVTLRVDASALDDLERLASALRDAGIDNFAMTDSLDSFDQAAQDQMAAIAAASGIDFIYDVPGVSSSSAILAADVEESDVSIQQIYRELLETFDAGSASAGDIEIADGTASALMEAGMLRAFMSDNLVLDASASGDRLLTTLKEIAELGFDEVRLGAPETGTIYVNFGTDAAAAEDIAELFSNLDLNSAPSSSLFPDAAHLALVVDAQTADVLSSIDGALEKLAGLGFDELDVLAGEGGISALSSTAIEVKLIGQDDELYNHLQNNQ